MWTYFFLSSQSKNLLKENENFCLGWISKWKLIWLMVEFWLEHLCVLIKMPILYLAPVTNILTLKVLFIANYQKLYSFSNLSLCLLYMFRFRNRRVSIIRFGYDTWTTYNFNSYWCTTNKWTLSKLIRFWTNII